MSGKKESVFLECFGRIEDPRMDRQKRHKLLDIIAIAVCATIAGADGGVAIELFGNRGYLLHSSRDYALWSPVLWSRTCLTIAWYGTGSTCTACCTMR